MTLNPPPPREVLHFWALSANKRGSTRIRLRSWPLRDCAITRRYACTTVAWKTLRRTRIYSDEWASGQKPHLTKQGQRILCKTENFAPLVVPGLSSSSGTSSSSTSPPQDSSSTSSSPATDRSDEPVTGNWRETNPITPIQNKKRNGNQDLDRLRDLPERLEEFTDNPEDTEVPAPANISQDSNAERPAKVASRKHSIYTHLPKDRNCEACLRTKMTRAPCRRCTGEALLRAKKFGDLILLITRSSRKVNHETITATLSWYKI